MAVKRRPTAGAYPAKHLRQPNAYWRSKGLVLSFLGNRLIYSRDTPVIPSVTQTGTPKRQSGPHSDAIGFGTTYGTGTTDMLTGGVLPVSLRTQARSIFSSMYLVGYGGGGLGRVFQDVTGSGVSGGEALYPSNTSTIIYNNYKTSAAIVISWVFPTSAPLSRWFTLGIAVPNIVGTTAETGYCYLDGKISSTVANNTAAGAITSNVATNLTWGNRASDGARGIDGMIGVTHFFEEALSPEDFSDLDANPDCVWDTVDVRRTISTGAPTLTGQAVVAAVGTLSPTASIALTGNAAVAAQGAASPSALLPLTGLATSAAQGTVAPVITVALTGQGATAATGTLTVSGSPDITLALTGQATAVAQGSLLAAATTALSGQSTSVAQGAVLPQIDKTLTGQAVAPAQGSVLPQTGVALLGQGVSVGQGAMVAPGDLTVALMGVGVTVGQGALTASITPDPGNGKSGVNRMWLIEYYTKEFAKKAPIAVPEEIVGFAAKRNALNRAKAVRAKQIEALAVKAESDLEALAQGVEDVRAAQQFTYNLIHQAQRRPEPEIDFMHVADSYRKRMKQEDDDLMLFAMVI